MPAATVDALAAHGAMNAPTMTAATPSGPATGPSSAAAGGPAVEDTLPPVTDGGADDMPAATVDALAAHGAMNAPTMTEVTPESATTDRATPATAPAAGDGGEA